MAKKRAERVEANAAAAWGIKWNGGPMSFAFPTEHVIDQVLEKSEGEKVLVVILLESDYRRLLKQARAK